MEKPYVEAAREPMQSLMYALSEWWDQCMIVILAKLWKTLDPFEDLTIWSMDWMTSAWDSWFSRPTNEPLIDWEFRYTLRTVSKPYNALGDIESRGPSGFASWHGEIQKVSCWSVCSIRRSRGGPNSAKSRNTVPWSRGWEGIYKYHQMQLLCVSLRTDI